MKGRELLSGIAVSETIDTVGAYVLARHKRGPGRGAGRAHAEGILESDSLRGQSIEMRSLDIRISIAGEILPADIICGDKEDIVGMLPPLRP